MRAGVMIRGESPFQFVLDELLPLRPMIRRMFGFTYVYLDEKLLLSLRESAKQPQFNGVWLYTQAAHIDSLRREFPLLPRRAFWKSGKNGWVILASRLEEFEEYAFKACALILRGDRRVGRVTRRGAKSLPTKAAERPSRVEKSTSRVG
jgi:hypothetical protein